MSEKTPSAEAALTAALEAALKQGPKSNKALKAELPKKAAVSDSKLDRTLQELRKSGKIKVTEGKWQLSSFKTCHTCKGRGWLDE